MAQKHFMWLWSYALMALVPLVALAIPVWPSYAWVVIIVSFALTVLAICFNGREAAKAQNEQLTVRAETNEQISRLSSSIAESISKLAPDDNATREAASTLLEAVNVALRLWGLTVMESKMLHDIVMRLKGREQDNRVAILYRRSRWRFDKTYRPDLLNISQRIKSLGIQTRELDAILSGTDQRLMGEDEALVLLALIGDMMQRFVWKK